jgi:hypothetical protein
VASDFDGVVFNILGEERLYYCFGVTPAPHY